MAVENDSGRKVFKAIVTILVLAGALGCGAAWAFWDGMNGKVANPVKQQRQAVRSTVGKIFEIREYLAPSLENYHELVAEGQIDKPDEALMEGTFDRLNAVIRELGIPDSGFVVYPVNSDDKPLKGTALVGYEVDVTVKLESFAKCNEVIEAINLGFSSYATMSEMEISLENERELSMGRRRVGMEQPRYKLVFKLKWWQQDPNAAKEKDSRPAGGSGRPSA